MKPKPLYFLTFGTLGLVLPAAADVIYSNLRDIAIPATFDGLYLNVETGAWNTNMAAPEAGWDINPFYGGKSVANSPDFQPVRSGTGNMDPILNLSTGTTVSSGSVFSTFTWDHDNNINTPEVPGYGGSQTLTGMGGNFTADQEGYLGFKLNGSDYGWMRVVFTNNTGGALIKDWAYNTGGGSIATGNVLQNGSTVTLDSTFGSFTLGSAVTGTNQLVKTGTATLNASNTHSGATSINTGTLALGSSGSIGNSPVITVASGAGLDVAAVTGGWTLGSTQTLTGSGGVTGNVTIAGTHNAGDPASNNGVGSQAITGNLTYASGSIFEWDLNANSTSSRGTNYDAVDVANTLTVDNTSGTGTIFKIVLGSGVTADPFWTNPLVPRTWSDIFSGTLSGLGFNTANIEVTGPGAANIGAGSWTITGTSLTWTAIPEPTTALAGLLLTAGLLRRRRNVKC